MFHRRFLIGLATACLFLPSLMAGAEGNPSQETPSSGSIVKLGAGSVDAVTGNLSLRVPLGPHLPGRLPIGFAWNFSSGDGVQNLIGGISGRWFGPPRRSGIAHFRPPSW